MKIIRTKLCTLLLAVVFVLSLLPANVLADDYSGIIVNGERWDDQTSNADGSITWDPATKTFTLKNATLTAWNEFYLDDENDTLTVRLIGENTITSSGCGILTYSNMLVLAEPGSSLKYTAEAQTGNAFYAAKNLTIQGGRYDLTSYYPALFAGETITLDGAELSATANGDSALYTQQGDILIQNGTKLTVKAPVSTAVFSPSGKVAVSGQDTVADLTAFYCAMTAKTAVEITDGATVTTSTSDAAIYVTAGDATVNGGAKLTSNAVGASGFYLPSGRAILSGQGTVAEIHAEFCMFNVAGGVTVDDGAVVTGETTGESTAFYTSSGNIEVLNGAKVTAECTYYTAFYAEAGSIQIGGAQTVAKLTGRNGVLYAGADVTIRDGATLDGRSTGASAAVCSGSGNIDILTGAKVTAVADAAAALFAQTGGVQITGQETTANLTGLYCSAQGQTGVHIGDGATVTGEVLGDSAAIYSMAGDVIVDGGAKLTVTATPNAAIYTDKGSVVITGAGTVADLTADYSAIQNMNNITVSDGAILTGVSQKSSVIYSVNGAITLDGADVTLSSPMKGMGALLADSTSPITIKDSKLTAETGGITLYTRGNLGIADSTVNIRSISTNAIRCLKELVISGKNTSMTVQGVGPVYGGNVTIRGATVSSETTMQALSADGNLTISDGANVTAKTTGDDEAAIVSGAGDILLDGDDTRVEAVAVDSFAIATSNGTITLNAGHIKARTSEGFNVMMAKESGKETADGIPECRILVGEYVDLGDCMPVTTVWQKASNGSYFANTLLLSKDTTLNDQGLLDGEIVPISEIEIVKHLRGDLNDDEAVTEADALYLLYHTFLPADYPLNQACDFNGDGATNDADALYLKAHTTSPEANPLH